MKRKALAGAWAAAVWLLLVAWSGIAGTIIGSAHDFSTAAWSGGQVCVACHAPHGSSRSAIAAPLWNSAEITPAYDLYASEPLRTTLRQPTAGDKLCLSCHDGTVAQVSYRAATPTPPAGMTRLWIDLNAHHPSSFLYNNALASANGALFDPDAKVVTVGSGERTKTGTIDKVMLSGGQLQCSTCHDVHNVLIASAAKLLKISMAQSALCLACHSLAGVADRRTLIHDRNP